MRLTGTEVKQSYASSAETATRDKLLADCAAAAILPHGSPVAVGTATGIELVPGAKKSLLVAGRDLVARVKKTSID
jgi:hypothetical protein